MNTREEEGMIFEENKVLVTKSIPKPIKHGKYKNLFLKFRLHDRERDRVDHKRLKLHCNQITVFKNHFLKYLFL